MTVSEQSDVLPVKNTGFTVLDCTLDLQRKSQSLQSPPTKLLDIMVTMKRGWMSVGCAHSGGLPFPASGGKVQGQGTGCPSLQLTLTDWGRLLVMVRYSVMIQLPRTVRYLFKW